MEILAFEQFWTSPQIDKNLSKRKEVIHGLKGQSQA